MADRLPPGTELSEVALSRELSVSRGPIREAMGRLAAEGLVTVRPRRGAEVRAITAGELVDSYQVREALEVMAVRLATPRLTDSDLDRLEELVDSMAAHASTKRWQTSSRRTLSSMNCSASSAATRSCRRCTTGSQAKSEGSRRRPSRCAAAWTGPSAST